MPAVNDVGEPCAGEPHARFDGRGLETEVRNLTTVTGVAPPTGKPAEHRPQALPQEKPPRQSPTLLTRSQAEKRCLLACSSRPRACDS
jgi:hypothetical protein